jgi:tetratricopeptide (TPR) repeat protein
MHPFNVRIVAFLILNLAAGIWTLPALAQDGDKPSAKEVTDDETGRCEQATRANPKDADAWHNLGNAQLKANHGPEAVQAYLKAVDLKPDFVEAWRGLALAYSRTGKLNDAVSSLNKAINIKPDSAALWFSLGSIQERTRRYPQAAEAYEKAVAIDPNHADACFNLAILRLQFGKGAEAVTQSRAYLKLKGWKDSSAIYMALVNYFGQRQAQEEAAAKDLLNEASQQCDPAAWPFPIVRFLKGELGTEELLKAANGRDQLTEAHAYSGLAAMLAGDKNAALDHFRWVRKEGDQSLFEHRFATARLQELETDAFSPWNYRKHQGH